MKIEPCFLKSVVYHSREETKRNAFRYPVLNFLCATSEFENFKRILQKKFHGFLAVSEKSYLKNHASNLETEARLFISEKFDVEFENIVLQSMPKIGGYVFNPISFWYCYGKGDLQAVLCEVNNTFNEKHYYWLYQNGDDLRGRWIEAVKQFHVSPFFKVDGLYRFRFIQDEKRMFAEIDYVDQDGKLKLKTWINGLKVSVDQLSLLNVILSYAWMTPLVVFRIHFQAFKLFCKKIKFVPKPPKPIQEINHESSFIRD